MAAGKRKVWRLSKKGRAITNIKRHPRALITNKTDHYLAIGDCYLDLIDLNGSPPYFEVELREAFIYNDKETFFAPDAFFVLHNRAYFLEVSLSRLDQTSWQQKWLKWQHYYKHDLKNASIQKVKGKVIVPRIVVVSSQLESTVLSQIGLPITIIKNMKDLSIIK